MKLRRHGWEGNDRKISTREGARGGVVPLRCQELGAGRGKATQKVPVDVEKAIRNRMKDPDAVRVRVRVSSGLSTWPWATSFIVVRSIQ